MNRMKYLPITLGFMLAASTLAVPWASAQSMNVRVVMDQRSEEQNEGGGDDEIDITATIVRSRGAETSRHVWSGDMNDDGDKTYVTGLLVYDGPIRNGEVMLFAIHTIERDGVDYGPALRFAAKIGQAYATSQAGGLGAEGQGVGQFVAGLDIGSIINEVCANNACLNTDDYIGTFGAYIKNNNGKLEKYIFPMNRARWINNGTVLQLDGDGGRYYPGIRANGENFAHLK